MPVGRDRRGFEKASRGGFKSRTRVPDATIVSTVTSVSGNAGIGQIVAPASCDRENAWRTPSASVSLALRAQPRRSADTPFTARVVNASRQSCPAWLSIKYPHPDTFPVNGSVSTCRNEPQTLAPSCPAPPVASLYWRNDGSPASSNPALAKYRPSGVGASSHINGSKLTFAITPFGRGISVSTFSSTVPNVTSWASSRSISSNMAGTLRH